MSGSVVLVLGWRVHTVVNLWDAERFHRELRELAVNRYVFVFHRCV